MISFPLARYRLEFTVETPLHLPAYADQGIQPVLAGSLDLKGSRT